MEIKFLGGNCFKISNKKTSLIIDDLINSTNSSISTDKDIVIRTQLSEVSPKAFFLIDGPGEYEVSEVSIKGIPARLHIDEDPNSKNSTIYRILMDEIRICVVGHIYPELSDEILEEIGIVDVLLVPIGGNGYTLDGVGAGKVIRKIEPKVAIPSNYDDGKTKYEVPQTDLNTALKDLGLEPATSEDSLKVKPTDFSTMGDNTKLIVLNVNSK